MTMPPEGKRFRHLRALLDALASDRAKVATATFAAVATGCYQLARAAHEVGLL
ncbi:hypothetical protein [Nocardia sp. NPDC004722]